MKPCSGNRKNIALLAANALDASAAARLREHIATCAGCSEYLAELSGVASRLSASHEVSEIEASERFHQKLAVRIRATAPPANTATAYLRLLKWQTVIPVAGMCLLLGIAAGLLYSPSGPSISRRQTTVKAEVATSADTKDISPTLANYQNAANQSFDQLDSLLSRQAREGPPPTQIYRASATALAQEPL